MIPRFLAVIVLLIDVGMLAGACRATGSDLRPAPAIQGAEMPSGTATVGHMEPVGDSDGYAYIADVDLQVAGVPEVQMPLTVTASFTVPSTSPLMADPPTDVDVIARLFLGGVFNVVATSPPCAVCGDGTVTGEYRWPLTAEPDQPYDITVDVVPVATTESFTGLEFAISDAQDPQSMVVRARGVRVGSPGNPGEIK